jgi:anthranilate phosphoribosyltransferase
VAKTLKQGVERARAVIASGEARKKLDEFVAFTRTLKP